MKCSYVVDDMQPPNDTWRDDHLCVPVNSPFNFISTEFGTIKEKNCIKWIEPSGEHQENNFLCHNDVNSRDRRAYYMLYVYIAILYLVQRYLYSTSRGASNMRESHLSFGKMGINNLINDVINDKNYT